MSRPARPPDGDARPLNAFRVYEQASAAASPWGVGIRVKVLAWELCWRVFCRWTPKPLNRWRLLWLRLFGAHLEGVPFVHGRATIIRPWNLSMQPRSCIGDGAVAYCLDHVEVGADATVAQEAYLCTGTHDFDHPHVPLKTAAIRVGPHAFVGLRAIVLPGVQVGAGCVVGAGAVVSRDTPSWSIVGGNPARPIGRRREPRETA